MPSFGDINTVYNPTRKLNKAEVLRALQFGIASEYETIQIYQQIIDSTDNDAVKTVLTDLANDEMHHAGALLKLINILSPEMASQYNRGEQKVMNELGITPDAK
ncbi:MAG: rubrerythrin [Alphaproteobacteria bacterium]|nr:rubrerythrin [Alphaproteobacteria bacterium]